MQLSTGAVIGGRYLVERKIGSGAMGEVWSGEHIAVGYRVAIKTMLSQGEGDPELVERFKREALLLGRIRSDYVARILDFTQDSTYGFVLVLDLIQGEVFSATLRRTKLTVEEAIDFGIDVASGLADLHNENIVHRDLKPGNVILEPHRSDKRRAVIVDFGISRLMKREGQFEEMNNLTQAGMTLGTLEYIAPEQMLDSREATGVADIYALGAMLFRAVAGVHAFGNQNEIELTRSKLLKETPPLVTGREDPIAMGLSAIVARALKKKKAERYQRAEDMLAELEALRDRAKEKAAGGAARSAGGSERPPARTGGTGGTGRIGDGSPASVRAPASVRPPASVRGSATRASTPPIAPARPAAVVSVQDLEPAPMSVRSVNDSMQLRNPSVSRPVFIVSLLGALLFGLVLGGFLLGGSQDAGAGTEDASADAAAPVVSPPPPPPPPPPAALDASDGAAAPRDAGKKLRAPSGGPLSKPAKP